MPAFSFVFAQLSECLITPFCKRETSQCTAQEENLPEAQSTTEAFTSVYRDRKCKNRHLRVPKREIKMEKNLKPERVPAKSCLLMPNEGDLPELPSVSELLIIPAMNFKHLLPVMKPSESPATEDPNEGFPSSIIQMAPCLTSSSDQAFPFQPSSSSVDPIVSSTPSSDEVVLRPQSSTSQFALESDLIIIDFENEKIEHVEQSIGSCSLLRSEYPQMLKTEMKKMSPMAARMEVTLQKKEAWASKKLEDQKCEFRDTTQKKKADEFIENCIQPFCITPPDDLKDKSNVKKPWSKRNALFSWLEKFKKKEKKQMEQ